MMYELNKLYHVVPPQGSNVVVFSKLSGIELANKSSAAVGLKFVLNGREDYTVGTSHVSVSAGQFIVVNAHNGYSASITSGQVATGLCVDIDCNIISQVLSVLTNTEEKLLQNGSSVPTIAQHFSESIREVRGSGFVNKMVSLTKQLQANNTVLPEKDLFYDLAFELVMQENASVINPLGIETKKQSTREELYRRVKIAKDLIDDSLLKDISLDELATASTLSKFHLLRLFRKVYHISPFQYQVKRKLYYAAMLLKNGNRTLQEIALLLNYSDQQSLSKFLKKHLQGYPGKYLS